MVVPFSGDALPGFGEFLLIELSASSALVGRVSRYHTAGQLIYERGDAYSLISPRTKKLCRRPRAPDAALQAEDPVTRSEA